jgi:hypothetical protein
MRARRLVMLALAIAGQSSFAQDGAAACQAEQTAVPITYRFVDDPVLQSSWVLESLRPTLTLQHHRVSPTWRKILNGTLALRFCVPTALIGERFTFSAGPRSLELAARPTSTDADGAARMTDIALIDQPKPNWVVVKSIEQLTRPGHSLPSFDVEVFNFGATHPGGRIRFSSAGDGRYRVACAFDRVEQITVLVSLAGQKLRIASADPEYPGELVERLADVQTSRCGGTTVTADFGPTGRLQPGPTRIRYAVMSTKSAPATSTRRAPGIADLRNEQPTTRSGGIDSYFPAGGYVVEVVGEGIW